MLLTTAVTRSDGCTINAADSESDMSTGVWRRAAAAAADLTGLDRLNVTVRDHDEACAAAASIAG